MELERARIVPLAIMPTPMQSPADMLLSSTPPAANEFHTLRYWILALAAGLIAIQASLVAKTPQLDFVNHSLLPWSITSYFVWLRRNQIQWTGSYIAKGIGLLLLGLILLKAYLYSQPGGSPAILPIAIALGLLLLVEGFQGIQRHSQVLTLLVLLGPLSLLMPRWFVDISPLTAAFATAILWYTGFDVSQQGTVISLPSGSVDVYAECSGIGSISHLLCICLAFMIVFPVRRWANVAAPLLAMGIAFVVNGVRVVLLTILVANQSDSFSYWHQGEGASLFSLVAMSLFIGIYLYRLPSIDVATQSPQQPVPL